MENDIKIMLLSIIPALFFTFLEGVVISKLDKKKDTNEKKGKILFFILFAINEIFCLFWLLNRNLKTIENEQKRFNKTIKNIVITNK